MKTFTLLFLLTQICVGIAQENISYSTDLGQQLTATDYHNNENTVQRFSTNDSTHILIERISIGFITSEYRELLWDFLNSQKQLNITATDTILL